MAKRPLIIILGGTYGSGKTMLAHQLSIDLQIMQRTSLSSIIRTIKSILPKNRISKNWYIRDNHQPKFLKNKLKREGKMIGKVVGALVEATRTTGENYIIDGAQLLPEFLPMENVIFFRIFVSDKEKHTKMLREPNMTRVRRMTEISYEFAKKVADIIEEECRGYKIHSIDNIGTPEETSRKIIEIIKADHPDYREKYFWFEK